MSPDSGSFEARWFAPRRPRVPFEARRGYRPPPPSSGLVFTGLSLLVLAMGVTAIVVFFSPPESKHTRPAEESAIASAEVTSPPIEPAAAPAPAAEPMTTEVTPHAPPPRVASPPRTKAPSPAKSVPEFKIKN